MIYKYKDGKEITLRMNASRTIELEERTGKAVSELVGDIDKLSVITEFIAAAIPLEVDYHKRKMQANAIYDDMTEQGKNITDVQLLVFEVMKDAGFLTAQRVEMLRRMINLQEQLLSKNTETTPNT